MVVSRFLSDGCEPFSKRDAGLLPGESSGILTKNCRWTIGWWINSQDLWLSCPTLPHLFGIKPGEFLESSLPRQAESANTERQRNSLRYNAQNMKNFADRIRYAMHLALALKYLLASVIRWTQGKPWGRILLIFWSWAITWETDANGYTVLCQSSYECAMLSYHISTVNGKSVLSENHWHRWKLRRNFALPALRLPRYPKYFWPLTCLSLWNELVLKVASLQANMVVICCNCGMGTDIISCWNWGLHDAFLDYQ